MPPSPHAEREPELDNLRSVTRIADTALSRSDSACRSTSGRNYLTRQTLPVTALASGIQMSAGYRNLTYSSPVMMPCSVASSPAGLVSRVSMPFILSAAVR